MEQSEEVWRALAWLSWINSREVISDSFYIESEKINAKIIADEIQRLQAEVKHEHDLYLTTHRDNMRGANFIMEARVNCARKRVELIICSEARASEHRINDFLADRATKAEARVKELENYIGRAGGLE